MKNEEPGIYITNSIEIAAHIDGLIHRRIRGDLKISGEEEAVRVIFLGHGGAGEGSYLLLERLVAIGTLNRVDISNNVSVEYLEDGIWFYFESSSIDIEDREGCIRLAFPKKIKKSQKRRFFRARPLSSKIFEVVVNTEMIAEKCPVIDISAGGLAFVTNLEDDWMKPGTSVILVFCLLEGFMVKVSGILRSHSLIESPLPRKKYRCGVEFEDIPESIRDRIVRFVINLQIEEIKKRRESRY